jgi:hypothetical protein
MHRKLSFLVTSHRQPPLAANTRTSSTYSSKQMSASASRRFRNALKLSGLPHHKKLEEFDFAFQPGLVRRGHATPNQMRVQLAPVPGDQLHDAAGSPR